MSRPGPGITLIAAADARAAGRLAGILAGGHAAGRGRGPARRLARRDHLQVTTSGTVTAVTPASPALDQVCLYTLGAADAAAITGVLREAAGHLPDSPHPAGTGHPPRQEARSAPGPEPAAGRRPGRPGWPARSAPSRDRPRTRGGRAAGGLQGGASPLGPADRPVRVSVTGPAADHPGGQEITGGLRKARELLALLAVHPEGLSGEAISEALLPGPAPARVPASATSPCARPGNCSAPRRACPSRSGSSTPPAATASIPP